MTYHGDPPLKARKGFSPENKCHKDKMVSYSPVERRTIFMDLLVPKEISRSRKIILVKIRDRGSIPESQLFTQRNLFQEF